MSEQQKADIIRGLYAAFGRGDLEGILEPLDPQVVWRTPTGRGIPARPGSDVNPGSPSAILPATVTNEE